MDEKKVNIAVLFFGIPRCSRVCIPSIEKNILEPLRHLSTRVKITRLHHLYEQQHVVNPRSNENGMLDQENYAWFEKGQGFLQKPEAAASLSQLKDLLSLGDTYKDGGISIRNLLLQLNSLQQVTNLFTAGAYDVAVFVRPDLEYLDPLPARALEFAIRNSMACVVPNWQSWGGCNDRFSVCGRDAAIAYGNRLLETFAFCKDESQSLHSEKLLKYTIRKNRLSLRTISLRANRVRIDGTRKEEPFGIYESAPKSKIEKLKLLYLEKLSALM